MTSQCPQCVKLMNEVQFCSLTLQFGSFDYANVPLWFTAGLFHLACVTSSVRSCGNHDIAPCCTIQSKMDA